MVSLVVKKKVHVQSAKNPGKKAVKFYRANEQTFLK